MIPSRRCVGLLLVLMLLALLQTVMSALLLPLQLGLAGATVLLLLDFLLLRREPVLSVSRDVRGSVPVGAWSKVGLTVHNTSNRIQSVQLHDHYPAGCETQGMPVSMELPADRHARLEYEIWPEQRGDAEFSGVDLVNSSVLGFWQRKCFVPQADSIKIYPNFRTISQYTLLATDHQLSQLGVKQRQRRGEGNDFHQLREYRPGDALRQIDWKASSRYHKLISKEYQDERDQQIVFMLDCGRRMRHREALGAHLDQALNAMLLLAYVATEQGDAVGLHTFGGEQRWYPPAKGGGVVKQLIASTYDIDATLEAADYLAAARELMPLQQRRSLIVLMTNTRDEDNEDLLTAVKLLARKHLVVVADLRETILDTTLQDAVRDLSSAQRYHGVQSYLNSRRRNHDQLRHQGALTLDLLAEQLPVALVNQYFTVKASGRL